MYKKILKVLTVLFIAGFSEVAYASCVEKCQKSYDDAKDKLDEEVKKAFATNAITEKLDKTTADAVKVTLDDGAKKKSEKLLKDKAACESECG